MKRALYNWLYLASGSIVIGSLVYMFRFFINDHVDWPVLLFLNPHHYVPVLDEFMILITDFSMGFFGLMLITLEVSYWLIRIYEQTRQHVVSGIRAFGMLIGAFAGTAYFWAGYHYAVIFIPLACITCLAFFALSEWVRNASQAEMRTFHILFWVTLLSLGFTELAGEAIKRLVARPRPLSKAYVGINEALRVIPDERVRSGFSYVAGHASAFFALITPFFWSLKNRNLVRLLFIWASIHAFSRIYVAAHFPYCVLMGSVLGFSMGTWVTKWSGIVSVEMPPGLQRFLAKVWRPAVADEPR